MRAAKALSFFCSGYKKTAAEVVGSGVFKESTDSNIVVVKNIDIYSLCEHHMVPFFGKVDLCSFILL
jgi:GTP cyclohydrolase I